MTEEIRLKTELVQAKHYLNMKDVMLLSGLSQSSVRRFIQYGRLKKLQQVPNGKLLFRKADVIDWIEGDTK